MPEHDGCPAAPGPLASVNDGPPKRRLTCTPKSGPPIGQFGPDTQEPTCQSTIPPSFDAGPASGCSPAGQRARVRTLSSQGGQCPLRGGHSRPKRKFQVVRGLNNLGYSELYACEIVGLDRSTYYDIKFTKPNDREIRRLMLADGIANIHARSRGTYGILRVRAALEIEQGLIVNTKLVKRIMRELGYLTPNEFEDLHSNPTQQATLS